MFLLAALLRVLTRGWWMIFLLTLTCATVTAARLGFYIMTQLVQGQAQGAVDAIKSIVQPFFCKSDLGSGSSASAIS